MMLLLLVTCDDTLLTCYLDLFIAHSCCTFTVDLDLGVNGLTGTIPAALGSLSKLGKLLFQAEKKDVCVFTFTLCFW